jgi:hypothetical protein
MLFPLPAPKLSQSLMMKRMLLLEEWKALYMLLRITSILRLYSQCAFRNVPGNEECPSGFGLLENPDYDQP